MSQKNTISIKAVILGALLCAVLMFPAIIGAWISVAHATNAEYVAPFGDSNRPQTREQYLTEMKSIYALNKSHAEERIVTIGHEVRELKIRHNLLGYGEADDRALKILEETNTLDVADDATYLQMRNTIRLRLKNEKDREYRSKLSVIRQVEEDGYSLEETLRRRLVKRVSEEMHEWSVAQVQSKLMTEIDKLEHEKASLQKYLQKPEVRVVSEEDIRWNSPGDLRNYKDE